MISYDYSGYGRSEGITSENDICTDIDQVMDYAIKHKNIKQENLIL